MDQSTSEPKLTNEYYMTREFLERQISALQESIEKKDALIVSLQDRMSSITQRSYADSAERSRMIDSMQEWTMNALQEREISETNAEEIAEICGFELSREVEALVTVEYSITLQVPFGEEAEDMINDIDFESVSYNSDNITWLSSEVSRVEI